MADHIMRRTVSAVVARRPFARSARGNTGITDDDEAGLQATDGTPTGSLEDSEDRLEQGGGKPSTDERPSDPVPQDEVKPGRPNRDGT